MNKLTLTTCAVLCVVTIVTCFAIVDEEPAPMLFEKCPICGFDMVGVMEAARRMADEAVRGSER